MSITLTCSSCAGPAPIMALITLLGLYTLVNAIPQVALPINAQVPPVARTSTPFRFTFSASTFTSSSGTISFSLQDAPSWLQLDGDNRTLFGTPGSTDTGPATVNLTATDETGVANVQFTLVVSNSPGPQLKKPVSDQITSFGTASSLTSLAMYPSSPFSFTFAQGTFSNNGGPQYYYADQRTIHLSRRGSLSMELALGSLGRRPNGLLY